MKRSKTFRQKLFWRSSAAIPFFAILFILVVVCLQIRKNRVSLSAKVGTLVGETEIKKEGICLKQSFIGVTLLLWVERLDRSFIWNWRRTLGLFVRRRPIGSIRRKIAIPNKTTWMWNQIWEKTKMTFREKSFLGQRWRKIFDCWRSWAKFRRK